MNDESDSEMMYRFRHFQFSDSEEHQQEPERILCDSMLWCADPRMFIVNHLVLDINRHTHGLLLANDENNEKRIQ